jgi:hypothetical protein
VSVALDPDRLPDPACGYHLLYLINNTTDPLFAVYSPLLDLLLPWHEQYDLPDDQVPRPWLRSTDSRVVVAADDARPAVVCGQSEHDASANLALPAYRVTLRFTVRKRSADLEILLQDPSRLRFCVSRECQQTMALPVDLVENV